ncbi:head-tail adaptor [Mycobacterium phage MacnCheese]|uniref:Uncharacterized protein n=1 Tax=Mycobacterium phage MacnCheese TaxID=2927982 RepID=I6W816_9CAUD|nr:head-tail adaptor [Mycobacterium phage MacnCheese]AFN37805.1 hypothetical protein MACNCHEESE_15 [Mycobacterium phage MacnCheese]
MFPTPFKVLHTATVSTGTNSAGQAITRPWTVERRITSLRPKQNDTAAAAALRDRLITEYTMVTPDSDWPHGSTVTDWRGWKFTVHGDVEDFNGGPFGFTPGYRVTLRRVVQSAVPPA